MLSYLVPVPNTGFLGTNAILLPAITMPSLVHKSRIKCDSRPQNKPVRTRNRIFVLI